MKTVVIVAVIIVLLYLLMLYLISPGNYKKCYPYDWLYKSYIAHRGIYNNEQNVIENTSEAFINAICKGYNIETDIHLTSDNKLIIFHDSDFKRMFHIDKKVSEMTLSEIKELSYDNSSAKVLEFKEFLSIISGKTGLLLELKSQDNKKDKILCEEVMKILKDYQGNYVIQSFNPLILRYFKKHFPLVPRGQLYTKFALKEEFKKMKGQGIKRYLMIVSMFCYNIKLTNFVGRPLFLNNDYLLMDKIIYFYGMFMPLIIYTVTDKKTFLSFKQNKKIKNIIFESLEL